MKNRRIIKIRTKKIKEDDDDDEEQDENEEKEDHETKEERKNMRKRIRSKDGNMDDACHRIIAYN